MSCVCLEDIATTEGASDESDYQELYMHVRDGPSFRAAPRTWVFSPFLTFPGSKSTSKYYYSRLSRTKYAFTKSEIPVSQHLVGQKAMLRSDTSMYCDAN